MLTAVWQAVLNFFYPPRCPGCRKEMMVQGAWCESCLPHLTLYELPQALRPGVLDAAFSLLPYDGVSRTLLHKLKFQAERRSAVYFNWLLMERVHWEKLPDVQLAIPVPLSAKRLRERGFNQTELLFSSWCRQQSLAWADVLQRTRDTKPQWQLTATERRLNVKGAFLLDKSATIQAKNILLLDDIWTTGHTVAECARVLKRGGAGKVYALTIAGGVKGF